VAFVPRQLRGQANTFQLPANEAAQHVGAKPTIKGTGLLVLQARTGSSVGADTITKTSGSSWAAAGHSSSFLAGGAGITFKATQTNRDIMVGLSQTIPGSGTYTHINAAIWCNSSGALQVSESGSLSASIAPYTTSDELSIVYDEANSCIRYLQNGVELYRPLTVAQGLSFYLDSAILQSGGAAKDIRFGQTATGVRQQDVTGLAVSSVIVAAGQYLTIPLASGSGQLVMLTQNLTSDGSGNATAYFEPMLRGVPVAGATVESIAPWCLMAMDTPELGYSVDPGALYGFSFSATEAF
jgi:hypothetical protein